MQARRMSSRMQVRRMSSRMQARRMQARRISRRISRRMKAGRMQAARVIFLFNARLTYLTRAIGGVALEVDEDNSINVDGLDDTQEPGK
jgi:hypothetical protein